LESWSHEAVVEAFDLIDNLFYECISYYTDSTLLSADHVSVMVLQEKTKACCSE